MQMHMIKSKLSIYGRVIVLWQLIEQIGRSATSAETGSAEGCLRLLAHIFAIHVAHLTTGQCSLLALTILYQHLG
jgi:hypothetical protein